MATVRNKEHYLSDNVGSEDLDDLVCRPCHEDGTIKEAVGMCVDCQKYLCQSCYEVHKTPKLMRNHELINNEQMLESQVSIGRRDKCTEKCDKHSEEVIEYYCKNHCQLVCKVCISMYHQTCDRVTYIPHAAKDLINDTDFKQTEDQLLSFLNTAKSMLAKVKQEAGARYEDCSAAVTKVREYRQEINYLLQEVEAELVKKAESKKLEISNTVTECSDRLISVQNEVKQMITNISDLQKKNQNCDLYLFCMKSKDRIHSLGHILKTNETCHLLQTKRVEFVPNTDLLERLKDPDIFGKMNEIEIGTKVLKAGAMSIVRAAGLMDLDVKVECDINNCSITGAVVFPDNKLLLVDFENRCIKLIDTSINNVITKLKLQPGPWDAALITNGQVAVTLRNENKIAVVETGPGTLVIERFITVVESCYGVDYKEGKLAVSYLFNKVQVLDLQGTVLHTITTNNQGISLFSRPYYVAFGIDSSTLYVSNNNSHTVVCVKVDGTLVATYSDVSLKGPRGLFTDRSCNVYVCGQNSSNVHQFTRDCTKMRILLSETNSLKQPFSISYSEKDNKLYVGMWETNIVKVYRAFVGSV